jgi:hypothetical protein
MAVQAAVEKGRYGVGKKSFAAIGAVVLALTVVAVPLVQAEEVTRDSYKEAVEPICKANTEANERILKGARGKVKHGKLKQAAGQFFRAATALRGTVKELGAVPQPPADEAKRPTSSRRRARSSRPATRTAPCRWSSASNTTPTSPTTRSSASNSTTAASNPRSSRRAARRRGAPQGLFRPFAPEP